MLFLEPQYITSFGYLPRGTTATDALQGGIELVLAWVREDFWADYTAFGAASFKLTDPAATNAINYA